MNQLKIFILSTLLFFTAEASAQKDVNSMQWKVAGELPVSRGQQIPLGVAGAVSGVHHDVLIVAGGCNFPDSMPWLGGKKKYYDDVYIFNKDAEGFLKLYGSFKLPYPIAYAASCSTPVGVMYAGGENETGISNKVSLIQWDTVAKKIIVKDLPALPIAVTNASITSIGNMVYLAGGETPGMASELFVRLDMKNFSQGWKKLPSLPHATSHAVMASQSNGYHDCIYLIGGRKKNTGTTSDLYSAVYQFDPEASLWTEKESLPYSLSAGTSAGTGPNHIMLFGGDKGETFHQTETLIAAIIEEKDETKKAKLNQEKIKLQSAHPGFSKEVLLYNTITNGWSVIGSIPFEVPVTTTAVKWGNCVIIPSGEIKAGVRTPQVLMGKLPLE